jgi:hypothetical protein
MISRYELKCPFRESRVTQILTSLSIGGFRPLHPCRTVRSVYFDSAELASFVESEEGIVPRTKSRLRTYGQSLDMLLETKYWTYDGRVKNSERISEETYLNYLKDGLYHPRYGRMNPVLEVSYNRKYFGNKELRVTVDYNISYRRWGLESLNIDTSGVLEVKTRNLALVDTDSFLGNISFERFSKYCRGVRLAILKDG